MSRSATCRSRVTRPSAQPGRRARRVRSVSPARGPAAAADNAAGGGIYVASGTLNITNSTIANNIAQGGSGRTRGLLRRPRGLADHRGSTGSAGDAPAQTAPTGRCQLARRPARKMAAAARMVEARVKMAGRPPTAARAVRVVTAPVAGDLCVSPAASITTIVAGTFASNQAVGGAGGQGGNGPDGQKGGDSGPGGDGSQAAATAASVAAAVRAQMGARRRLIWSTSADRVVPVVLAARAAAGAKVAMAAVAGPAEPAGLAATAAAASAVASPLWVGSLNITTQQATAFTGNSAASAARVV